MPDKTSIDHLFRKIAQNHEEPYCSDDWQDLQARLKACGLQRTRPYFSALKILFWAAVVGLGLSLSQSSAPQKALLHYAQTDSQEVKSASAFKEQAQSRQDLALPSPDRASTPQQPNGEPTLAPGSTSLSSLGQERGILKQELPGIVILEKKSFSDVSKTNQASVNPHLLTPLPRQALQLPVLKAPDFFMPPAFVGRPIALARGLRSLFRPRPRPLDDTLRKEYPTQAFHAGLIYPLSTNHWKAFEVRNRLSLHGLLGVSAALQGFEAAGLGNISTDYAEGAQLAGLFNIVNKDVKGFQGAGLFNLSGRRLQGVQASGIFNFAGYRKLLPYIHPVRLYESKGFNAQAAGIMNIDLHNTQNFQGAAIANVAKKVKGFQGSSILNVAEAVEGIQVSGLVNVASRVKGVQLGLINVADSVRGVPIGLLSIVRQNGFRRLEMWAGETFYANLGLKVGVRPFYNIFALSSQYNTADFRWAFGYGFGTEHLLRNGLYINGEAIFYHINEGREITRAFNSLIQFKLSLVREGASRSGFFFGPTLNLLASQLRNGQDSVGSRIAPWSFIDETINKRTRLKMWLGFNAGVRF
ncbi:MAG: hypothetical protein OHK0053_01780 [Microscillaceae bacterium]